MTDLRERRRQLLNLTITEIILIILFLVLLIAGSLIKKNKELRDQNQIYKNLDVDALQLAEFQKFKELIAELKEKNGEFADMDIDEIVSELVLAKEKYQENSWTIKYRGNQMSFTNAVWGGWEIISHEKINENTNKAEIRLLNQFTINQFIKGIVDHVEIVEINLKTPTIQEVFIKATANE